MLKNSCFLLALMIFLPILFSCNDGGDTADGDVTDDDLEPDKDVEMDSSELDIDSDMDVNSDIAEEEKEQYRMTYTGHLDYKGEASFFIPEIRFDDMPIIQGLVYSENYAVTGYVEIGNIVPNEGEFQFSSGVSNANSEFILVISKNPSRKTYHGTLDGNGEASVLVSEINQIDMPTIQGYVYSENYSTAGYVTIGNIVPGNGEFRFFAGISNANSDYILVVDDSEMRSIYTGNLDGNGDANIHVPEIRLDNMPIVQGFVWTENYSVPGYVTLGSIIPSDNNFRFSAGGVNSNVAYILVINP